MGFDTTKLNYVYFGIDFLEFSNNHNLIKFDFEKNIDEDNSNFGFTTLNINGEKLELSYTKDSAKGYKYLIKFSTVFENKNIPLFGLLYGGKCGSVTTRNKTVFYSSFFALFYSGFFNFTIKEFLEKYFDVESVELTRLDIACDLAMKLPDILELFNKKIKFHSTLGDDEKYKGYFQTYYTSQIQKTKNRNLQVRLYDKILDSIKKEKSFLFSHLSQNQEIRRLELELREEACKRLNYNILDIIDNKNNILSGIFKIKLSKFMSIFDNEELNLNTKIFSHHKANLKLNYLKLGHIPNNYMQRVNGYIKTIIDNTGQDGFLQLLLGACMEDREVLELSANEKKFITPLRQDPLVLLDSLIYFLENKLSIPRRKIWKILEKYKSQPKILISNSEIKEIFS